MDTNIKGTLNVLQAARELGTERVLVTSTSEVSAPRSTCNGRETPLSGAVSLFGDENRGRQTRGELLPQLGTPVTIVRPFNTYGPRQSARAVIPTVITQLLSGLTEIKLGSLTPTRDFTYVKDTVRGFTAIAGLRKTIGRDDQL